MIVEVNVSHLTMFLSSRELGVHVDGFIATAGHTLVVGGSKVRLDT